MKQRASEADCTRFKQMFRDRRVAEANSVGEGAARTFIDENWVNQLPASSLLPVARALFGRGQGEYTTYTRDHHVAQHDYSASLELVGPADCSFILIPVSLEHATIYPELRPACLDIIAAAREVSRRFDKPVVVQCNSKDVTNPGQQWKGLPDGFTILCSSLLRNHPYPGAHSLPYLVPDHLEQYFSGEWTPSPLGARPRVGFCGVASPLAAQFGVTTCLDWIRLAMTYLEYFRIDSNLIAEFFGTNMKHAHRARLILDLARDRRVDSEFILRDFGGLVSKKYYREPVHGEFNLEYFNNIRNADYVLCSRGTENYSIRFYETFCLGRIPVLVDSNVVLPFERQIDYEEHCVLIPPGKIQEAGTRIERFHKKHGANGLRRIQRANREYWSEYFSATGFYKNLPAMVERELAS